jgi:hypothetical protein
MSTERRALPALAALFGWACIASACGPTTVVASTCASGDCKDLSSCSASEQQYPESCDRDAGICHDVPVASDEVVCTDCYAMLEQLNIGSPVAPCGCTYCGLQLTGCFASADTEEDGDAERDTLCQAIVECGWANGCAGSDCYCGAGVDRDTCLKNANEGRSMGPCAGVIQAAAKCKRNEPPGSCVFGRQLTPNSVLDRATDVAKCVSGDPLLQGRAIEPKCR